MDDQKTNRCLISVVIDNFNYEKYLGEAIDSVLSQTRSADELIVVDDGSTDGSRAIIESYRDRLRPVFKENGGQASAFNVGFSEAQGEWILYLDADDRLCPDALEKLEKLLPGVPTGCSRIFWKRRLIDGDGKTIKDPSGGVEEPVLHRFAEELRDGGVFVVHPTSSNLFRRSSLAQILPAPELKFRLCADSYLVWRSAAVGDGLELGECLNEYRIHGSNGFQDGGEKTIEQLEKKLYWWSLDLELEREMKGREGIGFLESSHGRRESALRDILYTMHFGELPELLRDLNRQEVEESYCRLRGGGKVRWTDRMRVCFLRYVPRRRSDEMLNRCLRSRWLPN